MDESQLCKGRALCSKKNDLRWCKNSNAANMELFPTQGYMKDHVKCLVPNSNDTNANSQWIKEVQRNDSQVFHCLNRGDENPFGQVNGTDGYGNNKNWQELVEKQCKSKYGRRCLGDRPDQCISATSKYKNYTTPRTNSHPQGGLKFDPRLVLFVCLFLWTPPIEGIRYPY